MCRNQLIKMCFHQGLFGTWYIHWNILDRYQNLIVKLGSCSFLLKSLNSTLKVSIQKQKEQSWRYNHSSTTTHPPPPTHNFLILVEGWFSLFFSLQTKLKIFSISSFEFFKFPNSYVSAVEILSIKTLFLRAWLNSSYHLFTLLWANISSRSEQVRNVFIPKKFFPLDTKLAAARIMIIFI